MKSADFVQRSSFRSRERAAHTHKLTEQYGRHLFVEWFTV